MPSDIFVIVGYWMLPGKSCLCLYPLLPVFSVLRILHCWLLVLPGKPAFDFYHLVPWLFLSPAPISENLLRFICGCTCSIKLFQYCASFELLGFHIPHPSWTVTLPKNPYHEKSSHDETPKRKRLLHLFQSKLLHLFSLLGSWITMHSS